MTASSEDCRRILVLGSAISTRVRAVASRLAAAEPAAVVAVAVPEVETWRFRGSGLDLIVAGDADLRFGESGLRTVIGDGRFNRIVIPFGVPRCPPLSVARLVASSNAEGFLLLIGRFGVAWRPAIVTALVLSHVLAWIPLRIAERLCAALDGAGVVLGGLAAQCRRRQCDRAGGPVCHVVPSLGTGGTQRQVVEYFKRAQPEPPLRLIALFDHNDRFLLELEAAGLEVEILARGCRRSAAGRLAVRFFPNTTALVVLTRRFRAIRPSCVVSWLFQANVVAAPAARLAAVPRVVASIRNLSTWKSWPEYRRWWYWLADRASAALTDEIFANSRAAAVDYARWLRRDDLEVGVVSNGVDVDGLLTAPRADVSARLGLGTGQKLLLTVGRLSAEKDHATLLRAVARLPGPGTDWHLVVVGHGKLELELRELATSLGLDDKVTFAGRVDDPQSYFAAADLFILPSRIEGAPNALIEAHIFGLATVTTDWPGALEVVQPGVTSVVVPIGDDGRMASEISRLLADDEARATMGRSAAGASRGLFDIDVMVAAIDRISGRRGS